MPSSYSRLWASISSIFFSQTALRMASSPRPLYSFRWVVFQLSHSESNDRLSGV
uniref:Uncharacterized protein n=1 Tax=Anguilla anguilla TaxID=7936 RepID=A0A0E9WCN0_ANGAN